MTISVPWEDPLAYDQPIIAGRKWPGVARVQGCDRAHEWQVNKAQGSEGATTTLLGAGLAEPKITFKIWKGYDGLKWVDYFAEWDSYRTVFDRTVAGKKAEAIVVEHPQFSHNKIRAVVMKRMGDLVPQPDGSAEVTVELLEYRKPKPKLGSPASAGKDKGGKPGEKPKSEVELEIERINNENTALMKQLKEGA